MNKSQLANKLGKLLKEHHLTLVTSESCTGGGIAYTLSKSPKSSPFLERGYVTYSNQAKEKLLHVTAESMQLHGAVSEIIAKEMAEGALKESLAQVSISITGLAGEDKNIETKGEAWLGIAIIDQNTKTFKLTFTGKRSKFIEFVIKKSLEILYKTLVDFKK